MASSLALKRLVTSNLFTNSLRPVVASSQSASRLFNTNALRNFDDDDRSLDLDRSSERQAPRRGDFGPNPFSVVIDPFLPRSRLSQILNLMDRFDSPQLSAARGGVGAKETSDGLYLRMEMPGLGKEHVKVSVEQNSLIIKGEGEKESPEDEEEGARRYSSRIELPEKVYKTDDIKAEMKNGVLKLMVPKLKEEERSDVIHVNVE